MINNQLERYKLKINNLIQGDLSEKEKFEKKSIEVQRYILTVKSLDDNLKLKEYLEGLEIGLDGTVFSKYEGEHQTIFSSHFGLSSVLNYAFHLLQQETDSSLDYYKISFESLLEYIENAKQILNDMNYVPGDRQINTSLNLEIYQNPKNYSIVNFMELIPMTNEELQARYDAKGIMIQENSFITGKQIKVTDNLTPREYHAFYGEEAKKILGIMPHKCKVKK